MNYKHMQSFDKKIKVIVSTGFGNFHMFMSAKACFFNGCLMKLFCGAYPFRNLLKLINFFNFQNSKIKRFMLRGIEISEKPIRSIWWSELIHSFSLKIRFFIKKLGTPIFLDYFAQYIYQISICNFIKNIKLQTKYKYIYHFRAAYGLSSVGVAKKNGFIALCDHSLADPRLLDHLINSSGEWHISNYKKLSAVDKSMLNDLNNADYVLVNSDFVKKTLIYCGYDPNKIFVIYLGVDDDFYNYIPSNNMVNESERFELLFAGLFCKRKGADILIEALNNLKTTNWKLNIAGVIDESIKDKFPKFFKKDNVVNHGLLSREKLANLMSRCDIFVFPSRAEGSARVIFEALACGCFIITSTESGSIVKHGKHGYILKKNTSEELKISIEEALLNNEIRNIGRNNKKLIASNYRQSHYSSKLNALYKKIGRVN